MTSMDNGLQEEFKESDHTLFEQLDLQHYLRTLRKHKWLIVLFSGVVTALATYYAYTATPVYRSTSTLLIESQGSNIVQFEELVGLDTENQDYYQTQFELLRSRGLALRVVNYLELWEHPELSEAAYIARQQKEKASSATLTSEQQDSAEPASDLEGLLNSIRTALANAFNGQPQQHSSEQTYTQGYTQNLAENNSDRAQASLVNADLSLQIGIEPPSQVELQFDAVIGAGDPLSVEHQKVVNAFMDRLSVTPVRKTKLVNISFESTDPVFAAYVANTVADQYIESYLDAKLELTTKASRWLNERLGDLKSVLEESEDRLISFKQANGLVDVDGSVGRLNEQELLLATAELAQARTEFATQADLYREVQSLSGQPSLLESIPAIQADPLVQLVKVEQGQAQRSLDELRNRYGELHPRVIDAKSQLATISETLQGHLTRVAASISKDYQLARQRVASVESKLASGKQEIQILGTKKFELDELGREVQTNREIYNAFFSRITEAKSADGLETANARISDRAVPSISPIKPKKELIIALAAFASLVLSALMAVLYEQMDDTIKGTADVEKKLGLKLLGILPLVKGGVFSKTRTLPLDPTQIPDKKGRFAEAVNTARTAVCMDDGERPRKVIAVTSSVPGEGKSSTSLNLAYSLAQLERVLVIDCDMRKPTVAKAAGFDKNTPGLSSLITKIAPASECIKRGAFGGMIDVLPSGPIPDQPLELLASKRFEKIVRQLSSHYDRIIIDCAPTQAVSDALVISRLTDAIVYCIKSHETSIELVRRGVQRLAQVNAPLTGVIITQVDIDKITTYGGDYYYQGYYDYYGYTEKGEKNAKGGRIRLTQEELHQIRNEDDDMELDLDYMSAGGRHSGADRMPMGDGLGYDEFDETVRNEFPKGSVSGNRRLPGVKAASRIRGDLDIL